jgi:hypothetical protein
MVSGMTTSKKSPPVNWLITGYTTRDHLLLDLDDSSLPKVVGLVHRVMESYPEVGDALVLLSSPHELDIKTHYYDGLPRFSVTRESYHVVFSGRIGYNKCCQICSSLASVNILERSYIRCRNFRGDMTLRVSPSELSTGVKPAPVVVCAIKNKGYDGSGDGIEEYLGFCRAFSGSRLCYLDPDHSADYRGDGPDHDGHILTVKAL